MNKNYKTECKFNQLQLPVSYTLTKILAKRRFMMTN